MQCDEIQTADIKTIIEFDLIFVINYFKCLIFYCFKKIKMFTTENFNVLMYDPKLLQFNFKFTIIYLHKEVNTITPEKVYVPIYYKIAKILMLLFTHL